MAEKRMFTQKIIDSDAFLDMPLSTQALYFHLNMRADDDGFVNNPKRIQRTIGATDDDLKLLLAKRFIIGFESGIIVIKHWRMHNTLRKDRYTATQYQDELKMLTVKDNNAYTEKLGNSLETECIPNGNQMATKWQPNGNQMATKWQPNGNQMATQYRLDKERLDKNRLEEISIGEFREESPALTHNFGEFQNVFLSDEELSKLKSEFPDYEKRIERLSAYMNSTGRTYKNHYSTIKSWAMKEEQQSTPKQHAGSNVFLELLHDMEGQTE